MNNHSSSAFSNFITQLLDEVTSSGSAGDFPGVRRVNADSGVQGREILERRVQKPSDQYFVVCPRYNVVVSADSMEYARSVAETIVREKGCEVHITKVVSTAKSTIQFD